MLEIKGQVLHRVRSDLKVPGWLSNFNVLLTRKLPMVLLRNFCFTLPRNNLSSERG